MLAQVWEFEAYNMLQVFVLALQMTYMVDRVIKIFKEMINKNLKDIKRKPVLQMEKIAMKMDLRI